MPRPSRVSFTTLAITLAALAKSQHAPRRILVRCVIYARLSASNEQSVSSSRQIASCQKYAEARGWGAWRSHS